MTNPLQKRAFALVLVLIIIVLAATMAVFFLASAGQERRGVDLYARGGHVRHLAGMAVNRVMGQINAATKAGTAAAPVSWASQPGMVRTYLADGTAGNFYKLYSWDTAASVPGAGFDPSAASERPPAGWKNSTAIFADLNQPIKEVYPIVDPGAQGVVEGFSIDAADDAVSGSGSEAPMPAKWLYVLEDGQMVAPGNLTGTTATIPGATADNPIVGRVAFWADDETSKVNINTASEGSFWDWPKAATYNEMQFAGNPPVGGEFNRVPGHPAMTSLSAVFPELSPGERWETSGLVRADYRAKTMSLLGLTPRVVYSNNSSRGGTYPLEKANFNYGPSSGAPNDSLLNSVPSVSLTPKTDRLLVSPDEMIFTTTTSGGSRVTASALTLDMVRKRSFFLTSNSRAPETTLFETPRVSLWPVTWPYPTAHAKLTNRQTAAVSSPSPDGTLLNNNTWMRAEERLLAFTSILNRTRADGGDRYFFQRQNSESPSHDYTAITRNQRLLSYLRELTSRQIPGYGGNFETKLTEAGRDSVLANTFNSIRSLVNQYTLQDDGKLLYSYTPISFARFTTQTGAVVAKSELGAFSPFPIKVDLGSGEITTISEFPLLREAALVFFATDRQLPSKKPDPSLNFNDPLSWNNLINVNNAPGASVGAQTTKMRAVMILDFFNLRGSTRNNQPVFWVKVSGATMSANGTNLGFGSAVAKLDYRISPNLPSYLLPFFERNATSGAVLNIKTLVNGNVDDANYGLISAEVSLDPTALNFDFIGGPMTIEIYGIKDGDPAINPTGNSNLRVATYNVDFSSWDGLQRIPLAPRWTYMDMLNSKKVPPLVSGTTNWKGSMCPNPGFSPASNWAAIEIAPAYRTSSAVGDPAMGGNLSIPSFSSIFSGTNEGSIAYPPTSGATSFVYRAPATYAFCDSSGETAGRIMTDYRNRMRYYPELPSSVPYLAENTLVTLSGTTAGIQFVPAGFPATTVYDTVLAVSPDPAGDGQGDPRLASKFSYRAIKDVIGSSVKSKQILTAQYGNPNRQYHSLGQAENSPAGTGYIASQVYGVLGVNVTGTSGMAMTGQNTNASLGNLGQAGSLETATNFLDSGVVGVMSSRPQGSIGTSTSVGDWSSGAGYLKDGGMLPRPDQDFQSLTVPQASGLLTHVTPYFVTNNGGSDGINSPSSKGYFSPNRQIPSPISLLGSLPSSPSQGWQTLLFSPNPAAGSAHPGMTSPPDYLILDLFWMPVAEPYPISEEFSTAGKINLNYKIMPFSYINRSTGVHALLKATWLTALDNSLARNYKSHFFVRGMPNSQTRYSIDTAETLKLFDDEVFGSGDLFRAASQICSILLVPKGRSAADVSSFWDGKLLTSDTAREQPYDHVYSRVTTKSNTFTVHWRVQALRKVTSGPAGVWDESKDKMASELRGATMIERFIDPNATNIPDYTTDAAALPLSNFYKWRVVSETFFQP